MPEKQKQIKGNRLWEIARKFITALLLLCRKLSSSAPPPLLTVRGAECALAPSIGHSVEKCKQPVGAVPRVEKFASHLLAGPTTNNARKYVIKSGIK